MLYDLSMSERKVYVIQEIAGTKAGNPKINIIGASNYGDFKFLLPEFSQGDQSYEAFEKLDGSNTQIKRAYGVWHDTIESNGKMYKLQNTGNQARKDTLWKAFNCVTYNEDHLRGGENNVSSRLKNNLINNGKDNIKDSAMTKALELAS